MSRVKELITAAGTLACALGIGFVMQSQSGGPNFSVRTSTPATQVTAAQPEQTQTSTEALIDTNTIELTSAQTSVQLEPLPDDSMVMDKPAVIPEPEGAVAEIEDLEDVVTPVSLTQSCDIIATSSPLENALVAFQVIAPCNPNERLTIHHSGMMFHATTDTQGQLDINVPALTENAVIIAAFENGEGAVAQTTVPDISDIRRVVLQWKNAEGFELHAREFGAEYGETGHIWRDAVTDQGGKGSLKVLGDATSDAPLLAEVYTFPLAQTSRSGVIDLSVEALITTQNCGLEIEAQTIEIAEPGDLRTKTVTLAVPDCEATGDYLVLNNVLEDLKIAAR